MTPLGQGRGHISHIVKLQIDQTNYVYSNNDQGRLYQNCKFHDPRGSAILVLRRDIDQTN